MSELVFCGKRTEGVADRRIVLLACLNPKSPNYKARVTPEDCQGCTARVEVAVAGMPEPSGRKETITYMPDPKSFERPRIFPDGTIAYPKRGWEPPPPMEGYRRKSENPRSADAWVFVPLWPPCTRRTIEHIERPCGAINVIARCTLFADPILYPLCRDCRKREVA